MLLFVVFCGGGNQKTTNHGQAYKERILCSTQLRMEIILLITLKSPTNSVELSMKKV